MYPNRVPHFFFLVRNTNFADCLSKIICFPRKPVTDKNSLWDLFLNIRPNCKSNMYGDLKRGDRSPRGDLEIAEVTYMSGHSRATNAY